MNMTSLVQVATSLPALTTLDPNSWVNDTIPIPPYLGLDGSQQAGLIAGYFIFTIILTMAMILALFNPCKASCSNTCRRDDGHPVGCYDVACCCCPPKEENWCYLCCSVLLLRLYFACCCRRCCKRSARWANRRADTLKEVFQQELDSGWEDFERGVDLDEEEDGDGDEVVQNALGEPELDVGAKGANKKSCR